jgi:hypothetical protein
MRLIRKAVILGLAVLGAQRLYELLRPRAEQLRARTAPRIDEAASVARVAAQDIKADISSTASEVQAKVADAAQQEREQVEQAAQDVKATLPG